MSFQEICSNAQANLLEAIPPPWRLPIEQIPTVAGANVIDIPRTCGLLTPKQIEITEQTATELLAKLANGSLTSVEVTEAFCARAAIAHQLTKCLTAYFYEEAMERAKSLDAHFAKTGETVGPLHGLPVSIKDQYDFKGKVSTLGYVANHDNVTKQDAALVRAFRDAGAVFFVKTTMPQTGMLVETRSNLWGVTTNPYNSKLVAGGSSGGDGVLIAMKGSPISPASDIGGSIRVPAAFNGLYSIRPSADRISKTGLNSTLGGQVSIKQSCGPICHSIADLKMFTEIMNAYPHMQFEPGVVPMPWRKVSTPKIKLSFGVWEFDEVCMPHPPILRALRETAQKLVDAGHEVVPIKLPFDCWAVALTTWKLFFQTGAVEVKARLAEGGEEMLPALKYHLNAFGVKALSASESFALNREMLEYKTAMSDFWSSSAAKTSTGRPFDGIVSPVHASASYTHNFPSWWGYATVWNILDYPSLTLPIKTLKISPETDPKILNYKPLDNPFDGPTYDMYDPELFASQPVCLQIIGRPFQDEEIISVAEVLDNVMNGTI